MPFGKCVQGLPSNELLCDLPLELNAVRTMLGHGFHPSKAQLTLSKQKPQPVRPKGRNPRCRQIVPCRDTLETHFSHTRCLQVSSDRAVQRHAGNLMT